MDACLTAGLGGIKRAESPQIWVQNHAAPGVGKRGMKLPTI